MSPRKDEHRDESGFRAYEWCRNLTSALAKFYHRFDSFLKRLRGWPLLLIRELESEHSVPFLRKLALWKRGFISPSYVLYRLDRNGFENLLSDYGSVCRARSINGKYATLLQDKYVLNRLLSPFSEHLPKFFGVVNGRRAEFGPFHGSVATADDILQLLTTEHELVLKLQTGKGGADFKLLSFKEETLAINDKPISQEAFRRMIVDYPPALLYARVQQHPMLFKIYPRTTNTLRIMTLWDDATDQPYIAATVQMIGTSLSYPTDHWSPGGICVYVDLETGQMGNGVTFPKGNSQLVWHTKHTETGAQIEGLTVPNWDIIKEKLLRICAYVPFLPYVGWDIVPTAKSFMILEGNEAPDLRRFQVHFGLMKDERTARFFRRYRVG